MLPLTFNSVETILNTSSEIEDIYYWLTDKQRPPFMLFVQNNAYIRHYKCI